MAGWLSAKESPCRLITAAGEGRPAASWSSSRRRCGTRRRAGPTASPSRASRPGARGRVELASEPRARGASGLVPTPSRSAGSINPERRLQAVRCVTDKLGPRRVILRVTGGTTRSARHERRCPPRIRFPSWASGRYVSGQRSVQSSRDPRTRRAARAYAGAARRGSPAAGY